MKTWLSKGRSQAETCLAIFTIDLMIDLPMLESGNATHLGYSLLLDLEPCELDSESRARILKLPLAFQYLNREKVVSLTLKTRV
jgi:hypothetical protein